VTAPQSNTSVIALPPPVPRSLVEWILLWFTLRDPVGRKAYAITGFGLMLFKYAVEAGVLLAITGHVYTPLDFVNPLVSMRAEFLRGESPAIGLAWIMWSLPFLWIAVSMSIRRAYDAGISPWNGFWVLVPIVNLFAMLILACLPTRVASSQWFEPVLSRIDNDDTSDPLASVFATIGGIAVGALYATVVVHGMTTIFRDYSGALFFGTPFITGVAAGYLLNLRRSRSVAASIMVGSAAVLLTGVGLLLFALEGVICLMMAAPIMLPLGMAGGPCGKFLADRRRGGYRGLVGALIAVPLIGGIESRLPNRHEFVVASSIDIAAPPAVVWRQVIAFPEIDERPEWFFRLGIACPTGAQIEGTGVGATRECLFTTGRFVEPITAWEPPRRLAFDVREQPEPMFELTPYRDIHPPHLEGAFRSTRGEFELVPLEGGRTRLVGRTWYTLDIRPLDYWSLWTDEIIHRIHLRVLRHIGRLAEHEVPTVSGSPLTL
jgi:uncharacterized membrane protein YhaH (DUF805 family)/uncharacterized protein YndB with AHSA1/START domain